MPENSNSAWMVSRKPGEAPFVVCADRETAMGYARTCAAVVKPYDGEGEEDTARRLVCFAPFVRGEQ